MASLNQVTLVGNLTRDPEIRSLANGTSVGNFGIAINEKYTSKDGEKKETVVFVDIEVWGRTAEICGQYLQKGRSVIIEGKLKTDSWEDKDGKKRTKTLVNAQNVQFLSALQPGGEKIPVHADPSPPPSKKVPPPAYDGEDDAPF